MNKFIYKFSIAVLTAFALSACGGGGGSSKSDSKSDSGSVVGKAIKGPIENGTVICFDVNDKQIASTRTDSGGNFKLNSACPSDGYLVVRGGFDVSATPASAVDELFAPGGSSFITPVSTMDYVSKKYNIVLTDSDSKKLIEDSSVSDPSNDTDTSGKSKKLLKMGVVLHYMVKNIQQQSGDNLSYEQAMRVVAEKLKGKKIVDIADDNESKTNNGKTIVSNLFKDLETAGDVKIPQPNKDKIEKIIEEKASDLQYKDFKEKGGLNDFVPESLREPFSPRYVNVVSERLDGNTYKIKFNRNQRFTNIVGLKYECAVFVKKNKEFTYRSEWASATKIDCSLNKEFDIAETEKNKFLVIKYSDKTGNKYGYSVPHKIGSKVNLSSVKQITFDNKVYLPVAGATNAYVEKNITTDLKNGSAISNLQTSGRIMGYLPVGFYYKPTQVATSPFKNTSFGVKLTIGSKNLIMLVDNLYIKANAMKLSSSDNPYLHSIDSTTEWSWKDSVYYHNANSSYLTGTSLSNLNLNRSDYHTKTGFLRFKQPSESDDKLKMNTQTVLDSSNLIGVNLADMCNVSIRRYKSMSSLHGTVCDYIRATINAENAKSVTVTPFIRAGGNNNRFTTNQGNLSLKQSNYALFPAITIKGEPDTTRKIIAGKKGLKAIDSDGDGISDYDEMLWGRKPFNDSDKNTDTDNDGLSDLEEIKLGQKPNSNSDKVTVNVSVNEIEVASGGSPKTFTVSISGVNNSVAKYVNVSLAGKASNAISLDVATGKNIAFSNTKTITVIPKSGANFKIVNLPKIVINTKITKGLFTKTLPAKEIQIQSDDFDNVLRPTKIDLSYKTAVGGSALTLNADNLLPNVEVTAVPTAHINLPPKAVAYYRWEHSDNGSAWKIIPGANTNKYVIKSAEQGKFIRVSAVYKEPTKSIEWAFKRSQELVDSVGDIVQVRPQPPTTKPTLTSNESSNTKYYRGSVITTTGTSKTDFTIVYKWQQKLPSGNWNDIKNATRKTYTIPTTTVFGTKYKGCYAYKKNGKPSAYNCSNETNTVEKRPFAKPNKEAVLKTAVAIWGTDITFTPVSGQEYRLVKIDGTANDKSTGITLATSGNPRTISANKGGEVKLQTRKIETPINAPSLWTSGVTVTFTKKASKKPNTETAVNVQSAKWGTNITFTASKGQQYQLVKPDGSTNDNSTGITVKISGDKGKIIATKPGIVKLQTSNGETPTHLQSDWTSGATVTFTKETGIIPSNEIAVSKSSAEFQTDIHFTPLEKHKYRLVKADGSANDDSTGITMIKSAIHIIKATKPGVVKIQTRKVEDEKYLESAWTSGKVITFNKQKQTINLTDKIKQQYLGKDYTIRATALTTVTYAIKSTSPVNATINSTTGKITGNSVAKPGDVTITITAQASDKYEAATKDININYDFVTTTGKIWSGYMGAKNWSAANTYCGKLNKYGKDTWRLATRTELLALVKRAGGLVGVVYPYVQFYNQIYWTSEHKVRDDYYVVDVYNPARDTSSSTTQLTTCVTTP